LDLGAIGLDLAELKRARDSIVHTGKMPEDMFVARGSTLKKLNAAQFVLQLLLLTELGYSGRVVSERDGWRDYVSIDKFLKKN